MTPGFVLLGPGFSAVKLAALFGWTLPTTSSLNEVQREYYFGVACTSQRRRSELEKRFGITLHHARDFIAPRSRN